MTTKSVAEKLRINADTPVCVLPTDHARSLGPLPAGARLVGKLAEASVAVLFADSAASLSALLDEHAADLTRPQILWVAYPKGNRADINRDSIWPFLGEYKLRAVAQVAVDETWSALRFRPQKSGEALYAGGPSSVGAAGER